MDMLLEALSEGKLCIVDVSQMRGTQSLILSGLILRNIFDRNQQQFTAAESKTIPTIAVVEEAQAVLNEQASASEPYIAWVKEGRKYDLGVVLVTQQPGSIPNEILSQGDNWFIFHLLSAGDLGNVKRANAHFSEDLLGSLLNEPIAGQGVFWSSVSKAPYPIALRALSFESMIKVQDPTYSKGSENTYAIRLRQKYIRAIQEAVASVRNDSEDEDLLSLEGLFGDTSEADSSGNEQRAEETADVLALFKRQGVQALRDNQDMIQRIRTEGVPWGHIQKFISQQFPNTVQDGFGMAYSMLPDILTAVFGSQGQGWKTRKNEIGKKVVYVEQEA